MVYNRKATAPWSAQREAGIESATVDSPIEVPQYLQPIVYTGIIDKEGNWTGIESSDKLFTIDTTHEGVPNGAAVLVPQKQPDFINMTGYNKLFIAIKNSSGSTFGITAVMGPDTNTFANLTPLNAGSTLKGISGTVGSPTFATLVSDSSEALTDSVWNIFYIGQDGILANQKNLQFKITNSSGGSSDIQFAYMRIV